MLGPSVLFASAPFALLRSISARHQGPAGFGLYLTAVVISALSSLAALGLLGLWVSDWFLW